MSALNLDLNYFDHPKTVRLVGLLGRNAEVLPIRLWCYCGKHHAESGRLTGYLPQEIEAAVQWWGKQGEMIRAMLKVGFLHEIDGGYEVHDWQEHSGHLAAFKERGRHAANERWRKYREHASSIAKGTDKQCPIRSGPTLPTNQSGFLFHEEQMRKIKTEIAKALGHSLFSEANERHTRELLERVQKHCSKHSVADPEAYAIAAARNLGKEKHGR